MGSTSYNASSGGPCLLNLWLSTIDLDNNSVDSGYHSVVAHHMTQVDQNKWEILIYDCALSYEMDYVLTVKKQQNGTYTKECSGWMSAWNAMEMKMVNALNVDDLLKYKIMTAPHTLSKGQSTDEIETDSYYLETCYGSFQLTDGTHTAVFENGDLVTADFSVDVFGQSNTIYEDPKYVYYLPVPENGYYEIFPADEEENHTTVLIYENETNGFYAEVQTSGDGSQKFFSDGTVQTMFSTPSEQTVTVSNNQLQTSWDTIDITSVSKGLTVSPSADKTTVTSADETVMSVSAETAFNTVDYENIPISNVSVEIIESTDGKCLIRSGEETLSEKLFGYSVIFDSGLGTDVPTLQNVEKGSLLSMPESPRRSGYCFEGWYKDEDYTEKWNFETDTIQEDTVLYAGWSLDSNYFVTVTFKIAGMPDQIVTLINGYPLNEADCPNAGYGDMEWFTDSNCKEPWKFGDVLRHHMILYSEGYNGTAVESVEIKTESTILSAGETLQMNVLFVPENAVRPAVKWTSSDETVAAVDQNGLVTGIGAGKAVITVETLNGKTAETEITVKRAGGIVKPVTSVTLNRSFAFLIPGETLSLNATVLPTDADDRELIWTSSDDAVAYVDENGTVTAAGLGKAVITATSVNGHSATCTVTVQEEEVHEGIYFKNLEQSYSYTGKAIKPEFEVYDTGVLLTPKTDYTITYKNTMKAYHVEDPENPTTTDKKKAPQIIIKSNSKGNYTGSKTVYFSIEPLDINDEQITVDELSVQAGTKPVSPVPVVYFNGKKLKAKTDFEVDYGTWDHLTAGDVTIHITGRGNFQGTRDITMHVASDQFVSVAKLSISAKTLKYADLTEENFEEKVKEAITVKQGKNGLTLDEDFTIEGISEDQRKVGSFTVTLVGDEDQGFYGRRTVTVKITGTAITDKKIKAAIPSYEYTGEPQTLGNDFSIKYNDQPLEAGKDYTIESYSNNINAGTATVVLRGLGNYTGTRKVTFKITPADATGRKITLEDAYYTKGGSKPKVTVDGLSEGTDYTLKYADNKKVTDGSVSKWPTVTITFKGNYRGTVRREFPIDPKPLSAVTITAKDKVYSTKANAWKSAPVLKDTDGKALKAGTDYEKNITYTTADGKELPAVVEPGTIIKVTVTGKGNYTDTITTTYRILETGKDISKMTFKINDKEYTGSAVTIAEADILSIKMGKNELDLKLGTDYEIVSYTNNIKKGTAKVTFRGLDKYGGEKTSTFKIGQRSIITYWKGIMSFFSDLF